LEATGKVQLCVVELPRSVIRVVHFDQLRFLTCSLCTRKPATLLTSRPRSFHKVNWSSSNAFGKLNMLM